MFSSTTSILRSVSSSPHTRATPINLCSQGKQQFATLQTQRLFQAHPLNLFSRATFLPPPQKLCHVPPKTISRYSVLPYRRSKILCENGFSPALSTPYWRKAKTVKPLESPLLSNTGRSKKRRKSTPFSREICASLLGAFPRNKLPSINKNWLTDRKVVKIY